MRELYVDGTPQPVGYMSHLRVDPNFAWGAALPKVLAKGWRFYRSLHADGRVPYYLLSLVEGESTALRLFQAGLREWPTLHPVGRLVTHSVAVRRVALPTLPAGVSLRRATLTDVPEVAACLARNGARRNFTPVWCADDLCHFERTPGLQAHNFWLAARDGAVIGCVARWDQQHWKQTIVRSYASPLKQLRPVVNAAAQLGLAPPLPAVGKPIRHSFASHWAVDDDDPSIGACLFAAVMGDAAAAGDDYLMVGLDPTHPLCAVVKRHRHVPYRTTLYLAMWDAVSMVDIPTVQIGAEIAVM